MADHADGRNAAKARRIDTPASTRSVAATAAGPRAADILVLRHARGAEVSPTGSHFDLRALFRTRDPHSGQCALCDDISSQHDSAATTSGAPPPMHAATAQPHSALRLHTGTTFTSSWSPLQAPRVHAISPPQPGSGADSDSVPRQPSSSSQGALAGDGSTLVEFMRGTGCGVLFGLTSPIVGHPIDTVKTKMQAQSAYESGGAMRTLRTVVRTEGPLALWRGLLPPLVGSTLYRSVQFGGYSAAFAWCKAYPWTQEPIPGTFGVPWKVVVGGLASATARAVIETPLEFIKTRRQTGQTWRVADTWRGSLAAPHAELVNVYKGLGVTWLRSAGLMTSFFMMVDSLVRHAPDLINAPLAGPFIKGSICATLAWWLVWPLERIKSHLQAASEGVPANAGWVERTRFVLAHRGGIVGLYRGIGPGTARSVVANGASMLVMTTCLAAFNTSAS